MLPGKGPPGAYSFTGLETPPPKEGLVDGQAYTLTTRRLSEISDQAPVYHHRVQVGEITGHQLSDRNGNVAVQIFVYAPHQDLIHPGSRFWVASGLNVSIGAEGVKLATAPLLSILSGGIVFDTPDEALGRPPSPPNSRFWLYADEKVADEAAEPARVSYRLYFPDAVRGVEVGTPVDLRGLPVGQVTGVQLEYDPNADRGGAPSNQAGRSAARHVRAGPGRRHQPNVRATRHQGAARSTDQRQSADRPARDRFGLCLRRTAGSVSLGQALSRAADYRGRQDRASHALGEQTARMIAACRTRSSARLASATLRATMA